MPSAYHRLVGNPNAAFGIAHGSLGRDLALGWLFRQSGLTALDLVRGLPMLGSAGATRGVAGGVQGAVSTTATSQWQSVVLPPSVQCPIPFTLVLRLTILATPNTFAIMGDVCRTSAGDAAAQIYYQSGGNYYFAWSSATTAHNFLAFPGITLLRPVVLVGRVTADRVDTFKDGVLTQSEVTAYTTPTWGAGPYASTGLPNVAATNTVTDYLLWYRRALSNAEIQTLAVTPYAWLQGSPGWYGGQSALGSVVMASSGRFSPGVAANP